jgi:hypothetical protein
VVRDVLRYLLAHPEAKDTADGIMRWWNLSEGSGPTASDVEAALDFFAKRSWVSRREVAPGVRLWGAEPGRLPEMQRFLHEMQNDEMQSGPEAGGKDDEWPHHP